MELELEQEQISVLRLALLVVDHWVAAVQPMVLVVVAVVAFQYHQKVPAEVACEHPVVGFLEYPSACLAVVVVEVPSFADQDQEAFDRHPEAKSCSYRAAEPFLPEAELVAAVDRVDLMVAAEDG